MLKTYTNTEDGKYVLNIVGQIISTEGMEVFKCEICDDLFAGREKELYDGRTICGLCEMDIKREQKDAYGIETLDEDEE